MLSGWRWTLSAARCTRADSDTRGIHRANLDGSNVEDLITSGLVAPDGLALDVIGGKMYWADVRVFEVDVALGMNAHSNERHTSGSCNVCRKLCDLCQ